MVPIAARLCEYGKPDESSFSDLMPGSFAEISTSCDGLAYAFARVKAIKYLSYLGIKLQSTPAMHKQAVLCLWIFTTQRAWARIILSRLRRQ